VVGAFDPDRRVAALEADVDDLGDELGRRVGADVAKHPVDLVDQQRRVQLVDGPEHAGARRRPVPLRPWDETTEDVQES